MGSSHRAYRVHDKAGNVEELSRLLACHGGANRDRTGDLLVANQTLSQLSYGPDNARGYVGGSGRSCTPDLTLIRGAL